LCEASWQEGLLSGGPYSRVGAAADIPSTVQTASTSLRPISALTLRPSRKPDDSLDLITERLDLAGSEQLRCAFTHDFTAWPTPDTLYMGFGIDGIATPEARTTVLRRSLDYLLR
jgi:hypothetical protein